MRAQRTGQGQDLPQRAGAQPQTAETPSGETVQVLRGGSPQDAPFVRAEDLGARDGAIAGSAVDEEPSPRSLREPPPEVLRWVVTKEASVTDKATGHRVLLRVGKVVDSINYDPKHLLRQGVRMTLIPEGEDAADVLDKLQHPV